MEKTREQLRKDKIETIKLGHNLDELARDPDGVVRLKAILKRDSEIMKIKGILMQELRAEVPDDFDLIRIQSGSEDELIQMAKDRKFLVHLQECRNTRVKTAALQEIRNYLREYIARMTF